MFYSRELPAISFLRKEKADPGPVYANRRDGGVRAAEYDVTNLLWKAFQELEFLGFFNTGITLTS